LAKAIAGTAEQDHALVISSQLQIVKTFAENLSLNGLAFRGLKLELSTAKGTGCRAMLNRTQEIEQARHFGTRDAIWRHPSGRQAVADQTRQLLVVVCPQAQYDWRANVAAVAIGAVASGAVNLESLACGIDALGVLCGESQGYREEKRQHGSQIVPNCLTVCLTEWNFSKNDIIACSVWWSSGPIER
jgi:hypothetical protein